MIDTGATNNYISSNGVKDGKLIKLKCGKSVKTIHGESKITSFVKINIFNHDLCFFVLDDIGKFDIILGMDGLRRINAKIDITAFKMDYTIKKQLLHYTIREEATEEEKSTIKDLIEENIMGDITPFNTNVIAEIRTTSNAPIWTKQFPYPMSSRDFVNKEITKLLETGVIRESRSPYNSPIWVIPKDGFNEDGTQKKRMVIDYGKLNAQTIFDRYPMPDINIILSNLGEARIFSKIDLESGFHQIKIKEEDIEKTAFSINGAKYEFTRMPFGLKNGPSIFQRTVDDILRPYIGHFAYVYMDDVIIFSKTEKEHLVHIQTIIEAFTKAHMKISTDKSFFFKKEIEFLGQVISHGRITVSPKKVKAIREFEEPKTLKQLRSFLGMAGTYRKYIKNYAQIVKPLTVFLGNENGKVKAKSSSRVKITLDNAAREAMRIIKEKIQENIELFQPNFEKPFELTTDASNHAIGAVLSQKGRPITFISRTLTKPEQNLATNEKELLAIVWALKTLRNYLYGIASFTIFTDHQPLTNAVTEKNSNLKLKRWKAFVEESGAKIEYKPGKENIVADALSRQYCNAINESYDESAHSMASSPPEDKIKRIPGPVNEYRNQFYIKKSNENNIKTETIFPGYVSHTIKYTELIELIKNMELVINKQTINALHMTEEEFYHTKKQIEDSFPNCKFIFSTKKTQNITDEDEEKYIITTEHERAHRNYRENYLQIREKFFFPKMKKKIRAHVIRCEICKKQKFDTHPRKNLMKPTPLPEYVGEYLQMDIFHVGKRIFYSTIDRYSKYVLLRETENKLHAERVIEEILQIFPACKHIMTDNEAIFTSYAVKALLKTKKIAHTLAPIRHSTSNAQTERFHRTIIEIGRCMAEQRSQEFEDIIMDAVSEYNNTIHSVINAKPLEVFFNQRNFPDIFSLIKKSQEKMLEIENRKRRSKSYENGDIIFAKNNRRDKKCPAFTKHIIKEDKGQVIITSANVKIHKDNIRS